MVGIPDGLVAPALVPVDVTSVAHEAAHIVGAVNRGWPRLAEFANCVQRRENQAKSLVGPGLVGKTLLFIIS